jgi:small subunit ribosomal protein S5
MRRDRRQREEGITEFIENVVSLSRVAKVTKGGRTFKISAWVVVGDAKGRVGVGHGKAKETPDAIRKAVDKAKKAIKTVIVRNGTLPHPITGREGASRILLQPAAPGTGIIAAPPVRAVLEAAGYENALTKSLGSNNALNMLKATLNGLAELKDPDRVERMRGVKLGFRRSSGVKEAESQTS